jgi:hypothetical protein
MLTSNREFEVAESSCGVSLESKMMVMGRYCNFGKKPFHAQHE